MPHIYTSLDLGVNEMGILTLTGYEPISEVAILNWTPAGKPFKVTKRQSAVAPQPIEIDGYWIPNKFAVRFYFASLSRKGLEWCAILEIEIGKDKIPRTVSIDISGDSFSLQENKRSKIDTPDRVERNHLELITLELRRLEALSVAIAAEVWSFDPKTKQWGFNIFFNAKDLAEHKKELKSLERLIRNRTAYRKLDNHYLERISAMYLKALGDGVSPYKYIMDEIGREESRVVSLKTVQRWVTAARKNGFLQATKKKKVSASKAGSKSKSKGKKGE